MAQQQLVKYHYSEDQLEELKARLGIQEYYIEGTVTYNKTTSTESFTIKVPNLNRTFTGTAVGVSAPDQQPTSDIVGSIKTLGPIPPGAQAFSCVGTENALNMTFKTAANVANIWLAASPVTGFNDAVTHKGSGNWV